jgi:hypothetical protein
MKAVRTFSYDGPHVIPLAQIGVQPAPSYS